MTEDYDEDHECATKLNPEEYLNVCRNSKRNPWDNSISSSASVKFRHKNYPLGRLLSNGYTIDTCSGWICAQRRPGFGIGKRGQAYKNSEELPDYLILIDDDTYINLDLFVSRMETKDPSIPITYAGHIFKLDEDYSFPWGGFGVIFSRGSLIKLIQPLHCVDDISYRYSNEFETLACERLNQNTFGEKALFKEGMSISDLAYAISARPYFCMHSDHLVGYFINHYLLSETVSDIDPTSDDRTRIHSYGRGVNRRGCVETSHICHKMGLTNFTEMKNIRQ